MLARLSAFVIWALVAATTVFWGLHLWTRSAEAPQYTVPVGDVGVARGDLTRLLGATPATAAAVAATPEAASRFRLLGIMAPKASAAAAQRRQGVALIAVDGKPARAFVVGSALDGDLVLQSVSLRTASIGPARGGAAVLLELPLLPAAATGTLAPFAAGAARNPGAAALSSPATVPLPVPPLSPAPARPAPTPVPPQVLATPPAPTVAPAAPAGAASLPRDPGAQTLTQ